jgi:cellulose synthase/poly-beta-1,6-N-acetylglucosamine synthase-like glycosyltransferase
MKMTIDSPQGTAENEIVLTPHHSIIGAVDSIGVVIPLHNKRNYVRRTIESVLAQTYGDFNLTVVDDGSTDDSASYVEQVSDPRVHLFRTPCRGPGAARNFGIRVTDAEWIGLLDADDQWKPTFLERTVEVALRVPRIVAVFTDALVPGAFRRRSPVCSGPIDDYHAARMSSGIAMSSSSILLRKAPFVSMGGFREDYRYAEDTEAWFRLSCEGPTYYIAEPLSEIEIHDPNSTTRSADSLERSAGLRMLLETYEQYRQADRIAPKHVRSCRRFMQQQRGRLALHLINGGQSASGIRTLLTGVPLGLHTWREYVHCASLALKRRARSL